MKIVFLVRSFYPHIGGVEKHVYEISKRLVELGHTVTIITEENKKNAQSHEQSGVESAKNTVSLQDFTIYRIPITTDEKKKKYQIWKWLWQHRSLIVDSDVIHCHDVFFWYLPFRLLYPTKKVFTTFHGYETVYPPRRNAVLMRRISKMLSTRTINVGSYIKKWYGTPAEYTTYGGIQIPKTQNSQQKVNTKLKILFIGRVEEDTGVYVYEEVLNILDNNKIDYTFDVIGDGSKRKVFERFGEVHGFVGDVKKYLKKADIVFASSYLSILDAFAEKKYVIAVYQNPLKKDYLQMTPFKNFFCASDEVMTITHEVISFSKDRRKFQKNIDEAYAWVSHQTWEELVHRYLIMWEK